eukprot:Skav200404  [mRNA]  locus=scaffold236:74653:77096:+ [translate_table: standard]
MDASDVSLAIRRAKRNNAKSLDLSRRGLKAWPVELFNLRQLESLDLSSDIDDDEEEEGDEEGDEEDDEEDEGDEEDDIRIYNDNYT